MSMSKRPGMAAKNEREAGSKRNAGGKTRTREHKQCTICLESVVEPGHCDPCMHVFCVDCITKWMREKRDCPQCRQKVYGVIFNIRSDDDYDELLLVPPSNKQVHRPKKLERSSTNDLIVGVMTEVLEDSGRRPGRNHRQASNKSQAEAAAAYAQPTPTTSIDDPADWQPDQAQAYAQPTTSFDYSAAANWQPAQARAYAQPTTSFDYSAAANWQPAQARAYAQPTNSFEYPVDWQPVQAQAVYMATPSSDVYPYYFNHYDGSLYPW